MERNAWYLVAYDIADPKRLAKVHRFIKQKGIAAQKSVFFVNGTQSRINAFLDEICAFMNPKEDDLRAYPIAHPSRVWTFGVNPLAECPVVRVHDKDGKKTKKTAWWKPWKQNK
jgi:CRISPR-associated protein Cas2